MSDSARPCPLCGEPLGSPLFDAGHHTSLTTLCERRDARTRVWACRGCGHLSGDPLPDTDSYYAHDYRILLGQDDEDQIYEVRDGRIVYRTQHQAEVLGRKLALPPGAKLLDYGCAKASTPRALHRARPDLEVHLFDVSEMYRPHWRDWVPTERTAVGTVPTDWAGRFDAVTSFFAFEHIPDPAASLARVAALLRDGGALHLVVPDTFGNPSDLIVIDHVHHFTVPSLHRLLARAGFGEIDIDAGAHRGALVAVARKGRPAAPAPDPAPTLERAAALARFWQDAGARIREVEAALADDEAVAVYGSGVYGAWIAGTLRQPDRVRCFLDRSPYQQGRTLFDRPIVAPDRLPDEVSTVFVGLNPAIARAALAEPPWPATRRPRLAFLDGEPA